MVIKDWTLNLNWTGSQILTYMDSLFAPSVGRV